jgi:hypothetical protein
MADLYSLLKQFNAIGGMVETGQAGFCMLMVLWQKANELKWRNKFSMTNAELKFKAGFKNEKTLIEVRNKLTQLGYFKYISSENRRERGTYILEFDLMSLLDCLPEESIEGNTEVSNEDDDSAECLPEESNDDNSGHNCLPGESSGVSSQGNSDVNSEGNINKLNKTKQNEDEDLHNPYDVYAKNIGPVPPDISDPISQYQIDIPDEPVGEAFMIDTGNNAGSMRYAKKVIISWLEKGIMAMDQLRIYKARWESRILRFVMKMSPNMLCKKLSGILDLSRYVRRIYPQKIVISSICQRAI